MLIQLHAVEFYVCDLMLSVAKHFVMTMIGTDLFIFSLNNTIANTFLCMSYADPAHTIINMPALSPTMVRYYLLGEQLARDMGETVPCI